MFCPKCGRKLLKWWQDVEFHDTISRRVEALYCVRCKQVSITGPDELGLRDTAMVRQDIGTVEQEASITGAVIGRIG